MRASALTWTRYRSFKERQRVELAPITLIIGRNGSGKSVISRLPVLLASGVAPDAVDPLNLDAGGVEHAASYQDLVHQRGRLPFSLGAEVTGDAKQFEFETTLRYISETRSLAVEGFQLSRSGSPLLRAELHDETQLASPEPRFRLYSDTNNTDESVHFTGLLPETSSFEGVLRAELDRALAAIREALPQPSYLGPFRVEATRSNRAPGRRVRNLGPRGQQAIELLGEDKIRFGGKMLASVNDWFSTTLNQGVDVEVTDERTRLVVTDARNTIEVSLADTGAGLTQVLPVVVQHFAFRMSRIQSSILIVEQPELHLHPAAHGEVMDLALGTFQQADALLAPNCLIETHSEQLIMRLRRRIAEGFDHKQVILWSLDHTESADPDAEKEPLKVIKFDAAGNPDAWPYGVFEEALHDLTVMRRAARERGQ